MFTSALACMLSLSVSKTVVPFDRTTAHLKPSQARELVRAKHSSRQLEWRLFTTIVDGHPRSVVLLGEIHLAKPEDLATARPVVEAFDNIATENGPATDGTRWQYRLDPIYRKISAPEDFIYNWIMGTSKMSPMDLAYRKSHGHVRNAEQLHVPHWIEEAALATMIGNFMVPFLLLGSSGFFAARRVILKNATKGRFGTRGFDVGIVMFMASSAAFNVIVEPLLVLRDPSMAEYISAWESTPEAETGPLLVIVGRAHLPGLAKYLTKQYGFAEEEIDEHLIRHSGLPAPHPL